jgi:hypothetical protein
MVNSLQQIESLRKGTSTYNVFLNVLSDNASQAYGILSSNEANLWLNKLLPILKMACEIFLKFNCLLVDI